MSNEAVGYVGMLALTLLILLRVPVAVALGLVGFFGYCVLEGWSKASLALGGVPMELASAYGLSVVPLFMLMGALATTAGLSRDLYQGANVLFRRTRGALAMAAIAASAAFGAVCGSSVATAATLGRVSIPEMLKARYSHQLAAGAVAAGGTLGILIPPSLILMIYAIIAQQSVSKLFAAALVPGLILTALYIVVVQVMVWLRPEHAPTPREDSTTGSLRSLLKVWHVVVAVRGHARRHLPRLLQPDRGSRDRSDRRLVAGPRPATAVGRPGRGCLRRDGADDLGTDTHRHGVDDVLLLRGADARRQEHRRPAWRRPASARSS